MYYVFIGRSPFENVFHHLIVSKVYKKRESTGLALQGIKGCAILASGFFFSIRSMEGDNNNEKKAIKI
jgi:hypothetical protein